MFHPRWGKRFKIGDWLFKDSMSSSQNSLCCLNRLQEYLHRVGVSSNSKGAAVTQVPIDTNILLTVFVSLKITPRILCHKMFLGSINVCLTPTLYIPSALHQHSLWQHAVSATYVQPQWPATDWMFNITITVWRRFVIITHWGCICNIWHLSLIGVEIIINPHIHFLQK